MELIRYLEHHFFTREQLLAASGASDAELAAWQSARMMPRASYTLRLAIDCNSVFGPHAEQVTTEYYAKRYVEWIAALRTLGSETGAYAVFSMRYRQHLARLEATALGPMPAALHGDEHIMAEWEHFLQGTYGLCTVSGLPEDIAAKEAAIALVRELENAASDQSARLRQAVALLDAASAAFAPHERERSSRRKYVDAMRARWGD